MTEPREPEPAELAARLLTAVLAGPLDIHTRLAIGAALATLDDVQPPPPPLPEPDAPLDADAGIPQALTALRLAAEIARDADAALRAGLAARELLALRHLPDRHERQQDQP